MPLDSALRLDPLESRFPPRPESVAPTFQPPSKPRCSATFTSSIRPATGPPGVNRWTTCTILMTCNALLRTCCWPDALDICRHRYPPAVIDALDGLGDEPWSDAHVSRALTLLNDRPTLQEDLARRYAILGELRRQYRAFIIDEYQDTNPSHYRLLARLWGRRRHHPDDPARPLGAWDPTVCIVGDMKQSIYRFRQAEVSVMRRAVASIRAFNRDESGEQRLDHLRQPGCGRIRGPSAEAARRGRSQISTTVSLPLLTHLFRLPRKTKRDDRPSQVNVSFAGLRVTWI